MAEEVKTSDVDERQREREKRAEQRQTLAKQRTYFLIGMLVLIVVFIVGSVILVLRMPRTGPDGRPLPTGGPFSVKTLTLEGNTVYDEAAVLYTSGVVVGQNIFTVDTEKVEQELINNYPYYSSVKVETLGMKEVKITVTETPVMGVIYADNAWILVGKDGKAVSKREVTSDRPKGWVYFKGAQTSKNGVVLGQPVLEDYTLEVLQTLVSSIEEKQLSDIIEIDVTDLSDIRMNWRGQIEIVMGNGSNLEHEVAVVAKTIPRILSARGEQITGVLNVSSYSNEMLTDQAVFTPSSAIDKPMIEKDSTGNADE